MTIIETEGLSVRTGFEISVEMDNPDLRREAQHLLAYLSRVALQEDIHPDETIAYGYWLLKFRMIESGTLAMWEYLSDGSAFVPGVNLTLRYWRDQHSICREARAAFSPPRPDRMIVVSPDLLEGSSGGAIAGVRYPSPEHMSGWWITGESFPGDADDMRIEHAYHVTDRIPMIAQFLALPFGYRFQTGNDELIRFDEAVAAEPAGNHNHEAINYGNGS